MRIYRMIMGDRIMEFFKILAIKWGTSMGSQPQKHKVFKKLFLIIGFVELFLVIILVKKFSSIGQFFSMLYPKYCKNLPKIFSNFSIWFFSILTLAPSILEQFSKFFLSKCSARRALQDRLC